MQRTLTLLLSSLLTLSLATACGGVTSSDDGEADSGPMNPNPNPNPDEAQLAIDHATADFGDIQVGVQSDAVSFIISNSGGAATDTLSTSVTGAGFSVDSDNCAGSSLAPDASCEVSVRFQPDGSGSFEGELQIDDGTASIKASLAGNGAVAVRTLQVSLAGLGAGVVASTDGRINCPGTCSASYELNSVVTLVAQPANGSSFASWGGACDGSDDCSLNIIADSEVTAQFNADPKTVFVSAGTIRGDVGGLAAADTFCQNEAQAAGLSGTYKAWLSDATTAVVDRFSHSAGRYQLVDGTVVADNWADLVDGTLDDQISLDQHGAVRQDAGSCYSDVWTGTNTDGTSSGVDCGAWTHAYGAGTNGDRESQYSDWTNEANGGCGRRCPVYCFQQ